MDLRKPCVKSMTQRGNKLQFVYIEVHVLF